MKIFLTGLPGCGKTTLIKRIVQRLPGQARGFYTEEIRKGGTRIGFSVVTLDGRTGPLSHTDFRGAHRVGRYGVDVKGFEEVALPAMEPHDPQEVMVIDEVGKMECFSNIFVQKVGELMEGPNPLLGSVAMKGVGFPKNVRDDPRVHIITITSANRDELVDELISLLAC